MIVVHKIDIGHSNDVLHMLGSDMVKNAVENNNFYDLNEIGIFLPGTNFTMYSIDVIANSFANKILYCYNTFIFEQKQKNADLHHYL